MSIFHNTYSFGSGKIIKLPFFSEPFLLYQVDKKNIALLKKSLIKLCEFLFDWLPIVGDPLTFVAGVMRTRFLDFLILVAIGKVGRYLVVMAVTDWFLNLF